MMADDKEFMTTLAKGLAVLGAFDKHRPAMTLSQAASLTGLSRATARHSRDSARLTAYYFFTLRFIHTGRGGSFPRVESETTPHTAQPKRRHNAAAAIAIMTKSGPCIGAHSTTKS